MKRIKCTSGLSVVKWEGEIYNFAYKHKGADGTVIVEDYVAAALLARGGYELVDDSTLKPDVLDVPKPKIKIKKTKLGWLKKIFRWRKK